MTFNELVKKYRNQINEAEDKSNTVKQIILEIRNLTCNGERISNQEQIDFLEALRQEIYNEEVLVHAQDNSEHLELLSQAIKALGGE